MTEKRTGFLLSPKQREHHAALETTVMGILNVTPDSFSDGGRYLNHEKAFAQARQMIDEGAGILDVGGESTRPGYTEVSSDEEVNRIILVVETLCSWGDVPVSVDTYKAETAEKALQAGATLVNDVWGLQKDPLMADVVAAYNAEIVIMHNRSSIDANIKIVDDMLRFFEYSLKKAQKAGIASEKIILDPGIGFGKTHNQNREALCHITRLKDLGYPVLVGVSRKSFIGHITGSSVQERLAGTLAAHLYAVRQGADIVRVHDVKAHCDALKIQNILETGQVIA